MKRTFLRTGTARYKRLGRRKLLRWRKPRGRHNKIREKRKSRPLKVQIGYRTKKEGRNKINGKNVTRISNLNELEKLGKGSTIIIGKMGKRKKILALNKAKEKGIEVINQTGK